MLYANEGVRPSAVAMTPDKSVIWEVHASTQESQLYMSPTCPSGLAEAALYYAEVDRPQLPRLGRGGYEGGIVYELDGYAMKMTPFQTKVGVAGLSTVRANVTLHEGLERTAKTALPAISPYSYSAPELHLAILPSEPSEPWQQVVSVMDIAHGASPVTSEDMPSTWKKRHAVYVAAFRACGLDESAVFTDDNYRNLKVSPGALPWTSHITKFDVVATRQYEW